MKASLMAGCYSSSRHLSFCVDWSARYLLITEQSLHSGSAGRSSYMHDLPRLLCSPFEHAVSNAWYIVVVQVSVLRTPYSIVISRWKQSDAKHRNCQLTCMWVPSKH